MPTPLLWPCRADGASGTAGFFVGSPGQAGAPDVPATHPDTGLPLVAADITSSAVTLTDLAGVAIPTSTTYTLSFLRAGIFVAWLPAALALTIGTAYRINVTITLATGAIVYATGYAIATIYQGD